MKKIRKEINKLEIRKTVQRIYKTKNLNLII